MPGFVGRFIKSTWTKYIILIHSPSLLIYTKFVCHGIYDLLYDGRRCNKARSTGYRVTGRSPAAPK